MQSFTFFFPEHCAFLSMCILCCNPPPILYNKLIECSKVTFSKVTKTIKKKKTLWGFLSTRQFSFICQRKNDITLTPGSLLRSQTSDTRVDKFNHKGIKDSLETNKNRSRLFSLPHLDPNANSNFRNT